MTVTLDEMREVAKRLPIGYYLGRKVPVKVDEGSCARCDMVKGEIHIGIGILQDAANRILDAEATAKWDREKLMRCVLYHEIGHLLLSPTWTLYVRVSDETGEELSVGKSHDIINIFEDERIETILSKFFYGVDFAGFCRLLCKGGGTSDIAKFFDAVRLRISSPEIAEAVDDAIFKTARIKRDSSFSYGGSLYEEVVSDLYNKIVNEKVDDGASGEGSDASPSGGKSSKSDGGEPKGDGGDGGTDRDGPSSGDRKDGGDGKGEGDRDECGDGKGGESDKPEGESHPGGDAESGGKEDAKSADGGGGDGDTDGTPDGGGGSASDDREGDGHDGSDADGGLSKASKSADGTKGAASSSGGTPDDDASEHDERSRTRSPLPLPINDDWLKDAADKMFFTPTAEMSKALERFAQRLAKKKGAQSAGIWSGLHGKIDTRRDALDKERIFRRPSDVGESLMTSINLVLWVDVSGSFRSSQRVLNKILTAAAGAERMAGGKLAVKVVKIGDKATVARDDEWEVDCCECNSINMTYHKAWVDTRDRRRRNIDIVVLDGDAKSDESVASETMPDGTPIEKVIWNSPDCHIICDSTNREYFSCLDKAHVTYVTCGYADGLEREVLKTLDRIL